jgi:hypothetical protein
VFVINRLWLRYQEHTTGKWQDKSQLKIDQKLKTVKLLEENTLGKSWVSLVGNNFVLMSLKAWATKAKIDKWDCVKQKTVCTAKRTTKWKEYSQNGRQ